jgi:hypothetical protein
MVRHEEAESMTPELQALALRLEEVEKQVARLAALVAEQTDTDRTVVARSFVVRDEQGQRRLELGVVPIGEGSPWLGLFDTNENVRACIGVGGEGTSGPIEGPWFELYNEKRKAVVEIRTGEGGNPVMRLLDANGKPTVGVMTSELGPFVVLSNTNGKQCLTMSISSSGAPWLVMQDADGDRVLKLAVESDGPCLVFGKNNQVFWSAPQRPSL